MRKRNNQSGFTLIEILVVIAIIAILVSIMVFNFQEARKKSRDKIRKSDLQSLQLAIELYKQQYDVYPPKGCGVSGAQWAGSESSYAGHPAVSPCVGDYIQGLVPNFIPVLPSEVSSNKTAKGYAYNVSVDGLSYKLITHHSVESELISGYADEFARYPESSCVSPYPDSEKDIYAVYSGSAKCW